MKRSILLPIFIAASIFSASPIAAPQEQSLTEVGSSHLEKVNINKAPAEELSVKLKGIGATKAKRIVSYRKQHKGFSSPEELTEVKGIGEKLLQDNISIIRLK